MSAMIAHHPIVTGIALAALAMIVIGQIGWWLLKREMNREGL